MGQVRKLEASDRGVEDAVVTLLEHFDEFSSSTKNALGEILQREERNRRRIKNVERRLDYTNQKVIRVEREIKEDREDRERFRKQFGEAVSMIRHGC